jgi:hypothetical protein
VEELSAPSIKQPSEITLDNPMPSNQIMIITPAWTQVFIDYIKENKLTADKEEATRSSEEAATMSWLEIGYIEEPHPQESY